MGFLVSAEVEEECGFSALTVAPSTVRLRLCFSFLATRVCQRPSHSNDLLLDTAEMRPAPLFTLNTTCTQNTHTSTLLSGTNLHTLHTAVFSVDRMLGSFRVPHLSVEKLQPDSVHSGAAHSEQNSIQGRGTKFQAYGHIRAHVITLFH